jgi:hypothetical protein
MKIFRIADDNYWGVIPAGTENNWAEMVAAAGQAQGLKNSMHTLGDPNDPRSPVAAFVAYPPNFLLPRHSHDSDRLELVIAGSVEADGQWLGPGDLWTSDANIFYGPHRMGPDGCTTMELICASGARRLTFDAEGKSIDIDFHDPASLVVAAEFFQAIAAR